MSQTTLCGCMMHWTHKDRTIIACEQTSNKDATLESKQIVNSSSGETLVLSKVG